MPRTTPALGASGRFPGAAAGAQIDPAWQPWLDLLEIVEDESSDPPWSASVTPPAERAEGAPLLHGAHIGMNVLRARELVRRLADTAGIADAGDVDPGELIRAAIGRDAATLAGMAESIAVPHDFLTVIAQMASMPLLRLAARTLGADAARAWRRGYCPVCGAWPSLVEMRGIERERHLRCGLCAADWQLPVLSCAFCAEMDHQRLGWLVPEGEGEHRRVETCESCHGYLKVVTTLGALPFRVLATEDLATVPLDLAAQDRGYSRPSTPGWAPRIGFVS